MSSARRAPRRLPVPAATAVLVVVVLLALVVVSCSGSSSPTARPSTTPTVSVSSAPPPPPAPAAGGCHALGFDAATQPVDPKPAVPCGRAHTSVTIAVGRIDRLLDGHLLAVDSAAVRAQLTRACSQRLSPFVGGDTTTQRLSRLEVVWFRPSLEQADAGADWYRCDVVGLRSTGRLLLLPARMRGALARPGALDRFGTCGSSAPDRRGFRRVACSEPHAWRAIDVIDLGADARYLDKQVGARADSRCQDLAAERAGDSLKYTWSFEWPARDQWRSGRRYGLCWVPAG